MLAACAGGRVEGDTRDRLPVIATFEGSYAGGALTIHEARRPGRAAAAALVDITPMLRSVAGAGSTVPDGPGCWRISSVVRATGSTHHERVYLELIELVPVGATTSVRVPASPWTAVPDFGISPDFPHAMWRIGELGRGSSVDVPISFVTCGGSTFRFMMVARGLTVASTERATLPPGTRDDAASGYPARPVGSSVASSSVALSDDGAIAAFATNASVLLGGATGRHIVVRDATSATIRIATLDASGSAPPGCRAADPHLSADGSIVVFASSGCTLLPALGAAPRHPQIYARDLVRGETTLVSATPSGGYAGGSSARPRISADGSTIVFESLATDLVPGTVHAAACSEVYRRALGTTTRVSAPATTCDPRRPAGRAPDVSGDGARVVFTSGARLVASDVDALDDVYLRDHADGTLARLSVTESGAPLAGGTGAGSAAISADGRFVVFVTDHTNVLLDGTPGVRHVYRRSASSGDPGSIERVTSTPADLEARGPELATIWPAISRTGRFVATWSRRTDLASVPGRFEVAGIQLYACDMESPAAALARCFVASTLQPIAGAAFAPLSGSSAPGARIALAVPDDQGAGYVAYQAIPRGWGSLDATATQVLVSPIGDPRAQMSEPSP